MGSVRRPGHGTGVAGQGLWHTRALLFHCCYFQHMQHPQHIVRQLAAEIRITEAQVHAAVELLDGKGREEELARMLGGAEVSKEARAAARKLLAEA